MLALKEVLHSSNKYKRTNFLPKHQLIQLIFQIIPVNSLSLTTQHPAMTINPPPPPFFNNSNKRNRDISSLPSDRSKQDPSKIHPALIPFRPIDAVWPVKSIDEGCDARIVAVSLHVENGEKSARGFSVERVAPLCNCRGCRVNVHLSQLAGPSVPSYGSSLCTSVCVHYIAFTCGQLRHHSATTCAILRWLRNLRHKVTVQ